MAGTITHTWNGTVLTITSDSGTSSADLKGEKGDTGIRGAQGIQGEKGEQGTYQHVSISPVNLLDNSSFEVAQAGYLATHGGTYYYVADRWVAYGINNSQNRTLTVEKYGSYISLTTTYQYLHVAQHITGVAGKTITLATKIKSNGNVALRFMSNDRSATYAGATATGETIATVTYTFPSDVNTAVVALYMGFQDGGGSSDVYWIAAYEGAYNSETLPAYQPKGYAADLAECQRYYIRFDANGALSFSGYAFNTTTARITIPLPTKMRISTPTINVGYVGGMRLFPNSVVVTSVDSINIVGNMATVVITVSGLTADVPVALKPNTTIEISADL